MNDPWGAAGPVVDLLILALLAVPGAAWLAFRRALRAVPLGYPRTEQLTNYQLAMLVGGAYALATTAMASLVDRGVLHPRGGTVSLTAQGRGFRPSDPVDDIIVHIVPARNLQIVTALDRSGLLARYRADLAQRHLLAAGPRLRRAYATVIALALVPVALVTARIVSHRLADTPVSGALLFGTMLALLMVMALVGWVMIKQYQQGRPLRTVAGDAVVQAARDQRGDDVTNLVALGGLAAHPDPVVAEQLRRRHESAAVH